MILVAMPIGSDSLLAKSVPFSAATTMIATIIGRSAPLEQLSYSVTSGFLPCCRSSFHALCLNKITEFSVGWQTIFPSHPVEDDVEAPFLDRRTSRLRGG
jgi:hypothetical protein